MVVSFGCAASVTNDVAQEIGEGCPPGECFNSNEVPHYGVHEANLFGVPDVRGFSLAVGGANHRAQIMSMGISYDLFVSNGRFIGRRDGGTLQGTALVGSTMTMNRNGVPLYEIVIAGVRTMYFPVGVPSEIEVYDLRWRSGAPVAAPPNICPGPANVLDLRADLLDMRAHETLVYEGDRFEPRTMTVRPNPEPDWFNFGCAGHTLAKLYLTRQTSASNPSWAERQASLKLMVADYCGTGRSFTVAGTPFRWQGGIVSYWSVPTKLEARWNKNGAKCLHEPRLKARVPEITAMISAECSLPACTNLDFDVFAGALRVSAIP
jgi:hypothetical protein